MNFPKMRLYTVGNTGHLGIIKKAYNGEVFTKKSKIDGDCYVYCELKKFNQITNELGIHLELSDKDYLEV